MTRPALSRVLSGPVLLVALVGAAACGASEPAEPAAPSTTATASPDGHSQHGGHGGHGPGAVPAPTLYAVQTGPLGVVLTDGSGHLLYRSDADSADPPTSTCADACAETWIPRSWADQTRKEDRSCDAGRA
jgi:Secreted repeat of unknown function